MTVQPMLIFILILIVTTNAAPDCSKHFFRGVPPTLTTTSSIVCDDYKAVLFDLQHKVPAFVAFTIRFQRSKAMAAATENWKTDDLIESSSQASNSDYENSGLDKGHLAPAKLFSYSCEAEMSTYTFANAAPQWPNSNRIVWLKTERFLRNYLSAHKSNDVHVIIGTVFSKKKAKTIGKNKIGIPDAYFTANWDKSFKNTDGSFGIGWGFVVRNTKGKTNTHPSLMTIHEIEEEIGTPHLFTGTTGLSSFFGGHSISPVTDRSVWESDLLRAWNGDLPPNSEPNDAIPEKVANCYDVCRLLEQSLPEKSCNELSLKSKDQHLCKRIEALEKVSSSKDKDSTIISNNCRAVCKIVTDPHAYFYMNKKQSKTKKWYDGNLLIAEIKDHGDAVVTAAKAATVKEPMDLSLFGSLISEEVYGGLDKNYHLLAWPKCDMQLENRKPIIDVDVGGRLLLTPIEFKGVLNGKTWKCVAFKLEGTKRVFGIFTGAQRVAVICEKYSIKKWIEAFDDFKEDGTAGGGKLLFNHNGKYTTRFKPYM